MHVSLGPPLAVGTMTLMGFVGKLWACKPGSVITRKRVTRCLRVIECPMSGLLSFFNLFKIDIGIANLRASRVKKVGSQLGVTDPTLFQDELKAML
jgi:hypothetical protein